MRKALVVMAVVAISALAAFGGFSMNPSKRKK